jgi:nitronate monooxygenase
MRSDDAAARMAAVTSRLRLPILAAPMFLVSGVDLVVAACRAGIIGAFPAPNARTIEDLDDWCTTIASALTPEDGPWAISLTAHRTYRRLSQEIELVSSHKPPVVITALGSPRVAIDAVQAYGGIVAADVVSVRQAERAVEAGVDALLLVCAGAGGHTGFYSPFAFIEQVRSLWAGPIIMSGAAATGRSIAAAILLGADLVSVGTRFIAADESLASPEYRAMVASAGLDDLVVSDKLTGAPATWLAKSLERSNMHAATGAVDLSTITGSDQKRWKEIWSAGQGLVGVSRVCPAARIVDELATEYRTAVDNFTPTATNTPSSPTTKETLCHT